MCGYGFDFDLLCVSASPRCAPGFWLRLGFLRVSEVGIGSLRLTGGFADNTGGAPILLQFIMQGLETDAQNFSGPGLVVIGGSQGLQDQHLLRLFYGSA